MIQQDTGYNKYLNKGNQHLNPRELLSMSVNLDNNSVKDIQNNILYYKEQLKEINIFQNQLVDLKKKLEEPEVFIKEKKLFEELFEMNNKDLFNVIVKKDKNYDFLNGFLSPFEELFYKQYGIKKPEEESEESLKSDFYRFAETLKFQLLLAKKSQERQLCLHIVMSKKIINEESGALIESMSKKDFLEKHLTGFTNQEGIENETLNLDEIVLLESILKEKTEFFEQSIIFAQDDLKRKLAQDDLKRNQCKTQEETTHMGG